MHTRAAHATICQLEAEGFRFSHIKGDSWCYVKDDPPRHASSPRLALMLMLAIAVEGCDDPTIAEYVYAGTQLAVEACIKRNASAQVDANVIKEQCLKKHERKLDPRVVSDAKLTADLNNPYGLALELDVTNHSTDQIITEIVIKVSVPREGGSDLMFTGVTRFFWIYMGHSQGEGWIYPGQSRYGYVRYSSDESDAGARWDKAKELMKAGAKFSYYISNVTGLGFKLK